MSDHTQSINYWIRKLHLHKHPEGGYFNEVYRASEQISKNALPARYDGDRQFSTSIYFLLGGHEFSSFHRIRSDETWHFYKGTTIELYAINPEGVLSMHLIGDDPERSELLQLTIPGNHWFAARVKNKDSFALVGCTVAPGFHFDDFELGVREELMEKYPEHQQIIREMTK